MFVLKYFPAKQEYAFIDNHSTLKPIPMGIGREEWFVSKEDAKDAARLSGYWMDEDVARAH